MSDAIDTASVDNAVNDNVIYEFSSVRDDDIMAQAIVYNALTNAESLARVGDTTLQIVDIVLTKGVRRGRGGQPDTACTNSYLIDVNGAAYFSQSDGVASSVRALIRAFRLDKTDIRKTFPNGYIPLKCVDKPLPNGNTRKSLVCNM